MKWGEARNFDMCINTSKTGIDNAVEIMASYIAIKESAPEQD
jgi:cytidylate kinase